MQGSSFVTSPDVALNADFHHTGRVLSFLDYVALHVDILIPITLLCKDESLSSSPNIQTELFLCIFSLHP